jgi:hypothetical protein
VIKVLIAQRAALIPKATRTDFFSVVGLPNAKIPKVASPKITIPAMPISCKYPQKGLISPYGRGIGRILLLFVVHENLIL